MFNMLRPFLRFAQIKYRKQLKHRRTRKEFREMFKTLSIKETALDTFGGLFLMEMRAAIYSLMKRKKKGQLLKPEEAMVGEDLKQGFMEALWEDTGKITIFPQDEEFLEFLHDARMDVGGTDIDVEQIPSVFAIAWPKSFEIDGHRPPPCLVFSERFNGISRVFIELFRKQVDKYIIGEDVKKDMDASLVADILRDDEICIAIDDREGWCISEILSDDIGNWFDRAQQRVAEAPSAMNKRAYLATSMALRCIVYMQTFPEKVVKGYPDDVLGRLGKIPVADIQPMHLKSPAIHKKGTHDSPKTHMRRWHFRRYPRQPDGSRKKGSVFVHGCIVNEELDPRTVIS